MSLEKIKKNKITHSWKNKKIKYRQIVKGTVVKALTIIPLSLLREMMYCSRFLYTL